MNSERVRAFWRLGPAEQKRPDLNEGFLPVRFALEYQPHPVLVVARRTCKPLLEAIRRVGRVLAFRQ